MTQQVQEGERGCHQDQVAKEKLKMTFTVQKEDFFFYCDVK